MDMKLSTILQAGIKDIELIQEGEFNSFALTNGKLKRDNKLLVYISNEKFVSFVNENKEITCIICTRRIYEVIQNSYREVVFKLGIVLSDTPKACLFSFHNYLNRNTNFYKNDFESKIDSTAQIHDTCVIPPKNIIIGKNVIIRPFVVLYENTIIEDNVIIGDNSDIGIPAFYFYEVNGIKTSVDSTGGVIIKKNVELFCHDIVARGTVGGKTIIGENTKIDGNVFIAHDSNIQENCVIPAGSTFAGSVTLKKNCFVGVGTNIVPQVTIGEYSLLGAGSVVTKDVAPYSLAYGNPAKEHGTVNEKGEKI